MIQPCHSEKDYRQLLAESREQPVLLMKHSTRCPISSAAHAQFERFAQEMPDVACWEVLVVEERPLSLSITAQSGVTHKSPQVMLFRDGVAVWNASHYAITASALQDAVTR
jgi:bacillithiol system protein YtxJ